jgi:phosphopantetheinyl transferase (holo-ACP synthase)
VFTPPERDRIARSENPDRELWTLWAAKEAAFKALSKTSPSLSSVPRLFSVSLSSPEPTASQKGELRGTVTCPRGRVAIRVFLTDEYVHCVGTDECGDTLEGMIGRVFRLADAPGVPAARDESRLTREAATRRLSDHLELRADEVEIRRIRKDRGLGPPVVYVRGEHSPIDLSLSHDGAFGAFVFLPL